MRFLIVLAALSSLASAASLHRETRDVPSTPSPASVKPSDVTTGLPETSPKTTSEVSVKSSSSTVSVTSSVASDTPVKAAPQPGEQGDNKIQESSSPAVQLTTAIPAVVSGSPMVVAQITENKLQEAVVAKKEDVAEVKATSGMASVEVVSAQPLMKVETMAPVVPSVAAVPSAAVDSKGSLPVQTVSASIPVVVEAKAVESSTPKAIQVDDKAIVSSTPVAEMKSSTDASVVSAASASTTVPPMITSASPSMSPVVSSAAPLMVEDKPVVSSTAVPVVSVTTAAPVQSSSAAPEVSTKGV